uniref:ACYPI001151 protein n=1 Tax=Acyrthosiphon pisum TaxID=7029 RepID=C4WXD7_ACYPI|nr:ACYPI001151 [Acyrthosiphon pisum]
MSSELEKVTEDIDIAVNLLNLLKSRYFFLRAKYDIDINSQTAYASKDIQSEYQYASNDLQSFIMLELHLLEYACTYGIYSMNMYATRLKTNLNYSDKDHYFLKLLKDHLRTLNRN